MLLQLTCVFPEQIGKLNYPLVYSVLLRWLLLCCVLLNTSVRTVRHEWLLHTHSSYRCRRASASEPADGIGHGIGIAAALDETL